MLRCIYLDPEIKKCLDHLRRSGKKAVLALAKVEKIIDRLQSGGRIPNRVGTMTRHGELRIKGVIKYDLGGGYRLITFKQGRRLFLLFAGTHDDCHRWIENNRDLTIDQIMARCTILPVHEKGKKTNRTQEAQRAPEEADHDPLGHVADGDLRQIFHGLVNCGF